MASPLTNFARFVLAIAAFVASLVSGSGTTSCATGGFIASCAYPGLKYVDQNLGMYCLNDNATIFGYNWTWVDLNKCLTNNDGQLVPSTVGGYSRSCSNCKATFGSSVFLTCNCWNTVATNQPKASVDLNTVIYNIDGAMGCCDQMGNKTWKGPQASA